MNTQERRRAALVAWIAKRGGHARVVGEFRLSTSQASYLSQIVNGYTFGEKAARNWEERLRLPPNWLDQTEVGIDLSDVPQRPITIEEALETLGIAIAAVPDSHRQELADDMRQWALYGGRDKHRAAVAESLARRDLDASKRTGT